MLNTQKYLRDLEKAHDLVCLHLALMDDNPNLLVQENCIGLKKRAEYLEREYLKYCKPKHIN